MGILKIVFLILVLFFPFAETLRFQFGNGVALTLNDVLIAITSCIWFILIITNKIKINFGLFKKPIFIFILIGVISLLINLQNLNINSLFVSALYLIRWFLYVQLYFIVLNLDLKFKKLLEIILIISGGLFVVFGYIQYFLYPGLINLYYLGWDDHLYRMFSTFIDPNFAGAFFVIYFMFTLNIVYKNFNKIKEYKYVFVTALSFLSLVAVYLTYSRSAFFMLLVAVLSFLWLNGRRKLLIFVLIALILLIFISPRSFQLEGTSFVRKVSSVARLGSIEQGIGIFSKNPILGVGFNSYRYAMNRYYDYNNQWWQVSHAGAGNDNSFLFVLATMGIIGFSAFIYLIFKILRFCFLNLNNNNYAALLISITLGLIIDSLFINSLFYVFILEWFWLLLGTTENN